LLSISFHAKISNPRGRNAQEPFYETPACAGKKLSS
jgi:hypothetical protein